jgi:hypothetical protein
MLHRAITPMKGHGLVVNTLVHLYEVLGFHSLTLSNSLIHNYHFLNTYFKNEVSSPKLL